MIAGYQNSINHDAVVMIDGDLQHPPEYIPHMIEGFQDISLQLLPYSYWEEYN